MVVDCNNDNWITSLTKDRPEASSSFIRANDNLLINDNEENSIRRLKDTFNEEQVFQTMGHAVTMTKVIYKHFMET